MIYRLTQKQIIPASLDQVWSYFATPGNLNEMTPADMRFEIVSGDEESMYPGQLIEYKIELLPGIKSRWLTEITQVSPKSYFIDEQRRGPYSLWHHTHRFEATPEGVRMTDIVTYQLPFSLLGDIVHKLWVNRRLQSIFEFRRHKVEELFGNI